MADCGLRKFISYFANLVLYDNGSASNAISAQIFKTLVASVERHSTIQADFEKDHILYHINLDNFDNSNLSFWNSKYYG